MLPSSFLKFTLLFASIAFDTDSKLTITNLSHVTTSLVVSHVNPYSSTTVIFTVATPFDNALICRLQ